MIAWDIAGAVVHSLWQGLVAALFVALADVAVAGGRASTRHAIRAAALAGWLVAFVATAWPTGPGAAVLAAGPAWTRVVAWIWSSGVAVGSLHVGIGWWQIERWRRTSQAVPAAVSELAARVATEVRVRAISVRQHVAVATPCVVGILRPLLLLPAGMLGRVSPEALRVAIVHELVHVRRLDPWINAMVVVARVVLFHHPVAWWLARQIRIEREHACDEAAAVHCGGVRAYGRGLVELEAFRGAVALGVPAMASVGLRARIERLLGRGRSSPWWRRAAVALVVVLVAAAVPAPRFTTLQPPRDEIGIAWLPVSVSRHADEIVAAGRRHGVDPRLLAIVVLVESGGDPRATSPVGARGLMQLMPATAADVSKGRGAPPPTTEALYDPAISLDLGAAYLAAQLRRFEGRADRIALAAAAYNAGPGRVRRWQQGRAELPAETRRYQELVRRLWHERDAPRSATLAGRRG